MHRKQKDRTKSNVARLAASEKDSDSFCNLSLNQLHTRFFAYLWETVFSRSYLSQQIFKSCTGRIYIESYLASFKKLNRNRNFIKTRLSRAMGWVFGQKKRFVIGF